MLGMAIDCGIFVRKSLFLCKAPSTMTSTLEKADPIHSYATRLPDLYQTVCKQLGGILEPSPPRRSLHKIITTSRIGPKGGTSTQQSQNRKPRKTLERVPTDNKIASQNRPPSLARSATDSALPNLKRELSEAPLSAIPATKQILLQSRREVDLTAIFQATEAKRKRKEAIDEELQGAIAALKKPNPRLAVKDLVESAERRTGRIDVKSRSKFTIDSLLCPS